MSIIMNFEFEHDRRITPEMTARAKVKKTAPKMRLSAPLKDRRSIRVTTMAPVGPVNDQ
jgi:hypothetical protein